MRNKILLCALVLIVSVPVFADNETTIGGQRGAGHIIQDEGTTLRQRPYLNLTGSGVTCSDTGGKTVCTLSGGEGGSAIAVDKDGVQVIASIDTVDFGKGLNVVESPTGTAAVTIDTTELDTTTFGSGSPFTWTMDAGAADPTIAFGSDLVTIGFSNAAAQLKINQTASAGTEWASGNPTSLIWINDDRTGTTANEREEASLVIDASSTSVYGLYNKGKSDLSGTAEFGGAVYMLPTSGVGFYFGGGDYGGMEWFTDDSMHILTGGSGKGNNNVIFAEFGDRETDFDHDTFSTNPTVFIHSATSPDTDNTQWISLAHDQTNGVINTGFGNIAFGSTLQINEPVASGTNNVTLSVPALAADTDYTFPIDDGSTGEVLSTNGAGVLDWIAAAGGGTECSTSGCALNTNTTIQSGANPTVDAAGEVGIDTSATTGAGLRFYADAGYTLPAYQRVSFILDTPTSASDYELGSFPANITIKAIRVLTVGGTNIIGGLWECDANGLNCSVVDADITATAGTTATDDASLSNPTIDANDQLQWLTTSVSGSVTSDTVTIYYVYDLVN